MIPSSEMAANMLLFQMLYNLILDSRFLLADRYEDEVGKPYDQAVQTRSVSGVPVFSYTVYLRSQPYYEQQE